MGRGVFKRIRCLFKYLLHDILPMPAMVKDQNFFVVVCMGHLIGRPYVLLQGKICAHYGMAMNGEEIQRDIEKYGNLIITCTACAITQYARIMAS